MMLSIDVATSGLSRIGLTLMSKILQRLSTTERLLDLGEYVRSRQLKIMDGFEAYLDGE